VLGEDVELLVDTQPALWNVRCDPGQVEQVILNLAVNARDAMPVGGRFVVATGNVHVEQGRLSQFHVEKPGDFVMLVVRDSGTGMSPEVKEHAFEPFFTTKPKGAGTGLGLATVYGIVKQGGGQINLISEPGEGTAFQILFPRAFDAIVAGVTSPASTTTRGTESILVVEDDPGVREVTVRSLRAAGYRVLIAASGRDALHMDPRELGQVHLVVTDVIMPGLDGPSMAKQLIQRCPSLRVLYVSGYTQDALAERSVLASGIEFLHKPFTPSSLLARVRAVLDAR
jgi:CheY-like chemotaxis protein